MAGDAVIGTQELLKELRKYGEDVKRMVIDEVEESATNIELAAVRNSPKLSSLDGGSVPMNKVFFNRGLSARVGVESSDLIWVYLEFGTGASAKEILAPYPAEVQALAQKYFITGEGTLRGQPYLYPAFFTEKQKFEQALKDVLETASQNFNKRSWFSRTFKKW